MGHRSSGKMGPPPSQWRPSFSVQPGGNARGIVSLSPDIYTSAPRFLFQAGAT
jgi:hypothetical protein